MKLGIRIQSADEPESINIEFDVPVPDKYVNILKQSGKLVLAVTQAIQNIKDELHENDS